MANPAIKNGYFPIANELAERFAQVNITGQQWRIIWVLLRKTWGFSNGERRKDWDWISISQFERFTGMKRSNVHNTLKSLLAKRLILKEKTSFKFNQNYNEWLLAKRLTVLAKRLIPVSQKHNTSVSQLATHNIKLTKETITKENIATPKVVAEKIDISKLLDVFYRFNPGMDWGNKTQRKACEWLIDHYGEEKAINTATYALSIQAEKYAPKITTPYLLKTKLGDLLAYYKKQTNNPNFIDLNGKTN